MLLFRGRRRADVKSASLGRKSSKKPRTLRGFFSHLTHNRVDDVTVLLYSALPVALELPGYVTTVGRRLTEYDQPV